MKVRRNRDSSESVRIGLLTTDFTEISPRKTLKGFKGKPFSFRGIRGKSLLKAVDSKAHDSVMD